MKTLPKITERQQAILIYIYLFRFLSRPQIQEFMNHKSKSRVITWLEDLVDQHVLEAIYAPSAGAVNKPAVYYMSLAGIAYLKAHPNGLPKPAPSVIQKLYRDNQRSPEFIDRCLLVADMALQMERAYREELRYHYSTAADYADPEAGFHFLVSTGMSPDIAASVVTDQDDCDSLIQILVPSLPAFRIRQVIRSYVDLYVSRAWEDAKLRTFPRVIFVCAHKRQLVFVKRIVRKACEAEENPPDLEFAFMTFDDVHDTGIIPKLRKPDAAPASR